MQLRDELSGSELTPDALALHSDYRDARNADGRLDLGRKDPRLWPAIGVVLDVLQAVQARVSDAAEVLGISTGNLVRFLEEDPKVWQQANILRAHFGQQPLRSS